ncbi:unnamed protein product [Symbiodinium microadriaticum]|nr:unnamed protein product [Symbiodinium microadriaticum]
MGASELLTTLEPELLRGVPLHVCLGGWAKHWKPPDPGMFRVDAANYELSRQADFFDDFLSHDWQTSRWTKLCTLLVVYNSRAALIAAILACPLIAAGRIVGVLPNSDLSSCLVYVVHLFFLCFWQKLRSTVLPPIVVFLDKLCIAQSPEQAELKKKGILGLAAFLNHSKRLVVLWSPRYFSRLWCAYEIAAFLTDHNKHKHILIMPVHAGITITSAFFFFSWVTSSLLIVLGLLEYGTLGVQLGQDLWAVAGAALGWMLGPVVLFGLPFATFSVRMAKQLQHVPEQLKTFEVQNAACFCCANDHKHPDTGAEIPCDRELVYRKLEDWYGRPTDIGDEHLRRFNSLVHHRLGRSVLRQMPHAVPTAPLIKMLSAATMPWFADAIERILWRIFRQDGHDTLEYSWQPVEGHDSLEYSWRPVLEWAFVVTLVIVTGLLAVTLSTVFARMFPNVRDVWLGLLNLTVCAVPAASVTSAFFLLSFVAADAWPPTIVFIVALLLGSCLLRLTLTNRQQAGASEELDAMSDGASTTHSLQLVAESLAASEVDHGCIPRVPSDVSIYSGGLRI